MNSSYYRRHGGPPAPLPLIAYAPDGFPRTDLATNPEGREACGFVEGPAPPEFDPATHARRWDEASEAWVVEALPPAPPPGVAEVRAAIEAERDRRLAAGFTYDFGGDVGPQVLQTRDAEDKLNWLVSRTSYAEAVGAGYGDQPGATFRTADNLTVTVTFAEGLAVLRGMAAWGAAVMARSWALKDQLDAGADPASIDLGTGWS